MVYKVGTAVHYARTPMQKSLSRCMQKECDTMIKEVARICQENEDVHDCMSRVIMADYKESLYTQMFQETDTTTTDFARFMRNLRETVFINELGICDLQNHVHDPTHYVFNDTEHYDFYEQFEKHGKNILEKYRKWCDCEEDSDFEYGDEDEEDYEEDDEDY
jgi:hypothetical protein